MKTLELSCDGKRVVLQLETVPELGDAMDSFMDACGRPMFSVLFDRLDPERQQRVIDKYLAEAGK